MTLELANIEVVCLTEYVHCESRNVLIQDMNQRKKVLVCIVYTTFGCYVQVLKIRKPQYMSKQKENGINTAFAMELIGPFPLSRLSSRVYIL